MTKNNLKAHLKWLLDQGPSLYPVLTPPAWESHVDPNELTNSSAPTLNKIASQTEELSIKDSQAIPRTSTRDTADNGFKIDTETDMARLMLAPSSASKPRMLSHSSDISESTRKPPKKKTLARSPSAVGATQTPRSKSLIEPHSARSSFEALNEQTTTPVRSKRKLDIPSSLQDIDTIDLTDDFDPPAPSSDIQEDFGEPRRLWNEDAASRREPVDKRGKKRKSDEYASDLLSPRGHGRGARSPIRPGKTIRSDRTVSPQTPRHALKNDPPQSRIKGRLSSPRRVEKALAIPDSDDDSVGSLFETHAEKKPESPQIAKNPLYPVLPSEKSSSTTGPILSPKRNMPISPDSIDMPTATHSATIQGSDTPSHRFNPIPPASPSASKADTESVDGLVERFLQTRADALNRLIARMRAIVEKNSKRLYEGAMHGQHTPELSALLPENRQLAGRIEAVEALKTQRSVYSRLAEESQSLEVEVMQFFNQGASPGRLVLELNLFTAMEESLDTPPPDSNRLHSLSPSRAESSGLGHRPSTTASRVSDTSFASSLTRQVKKSNPSPLKRGPTPVGNKHESATRSGQFDYDEPMISDNETTFTRTMGSPLPPIHDVDEFDLDDFDEEMLEAADNFEDELSFSTERPESYGRPVFAETSGNASRLPATQKSQNHSALWGQHPWTKEVKNALKERFHLRGFRPNQLEAIDATLSGKDTFVLMPTGGGKSLCYQLPSVISSGTTKGVTIVISPLLSLMHDQVDHLRQNEIKAYLINGETTREERQWIMSTLSRPGPEKSIELLYITPEMINKNQAFTRCLEALNDRQRLARIVIDEAHCVSQWGHDFRPDYKELGALRARLPGVPMMALTATATENVKVDVIHNLRMDGCEVFTQSFNRPNLTYEVRAKGKSSELLNSIADTITSSYRNKCGIIYCLSRGACERVAKTLKEKYRIKAEHYHAGLSAEDRSKTQQRWQSGEVHVIVATIAFGMGIDKPDVRFVIHHSIPKSMEGYYQETGRAGRDGRRSGCYLYFSYRDVTVIEGMINKNEDLSDSQKSRQCKMLRAVMRYCENRSDCRRVQVLGYFNEYFRREDCNATCDTCKSGAVVEIKDFSRYAASAIKIVRYFEELGDRVTPSYCVNILQGTTKRFNNPEHRNAPGFGDGADIELEEAERLFGKLFAEGGLREDNVVNKANFPTQYVRLGFRAADFEDGRRRLKLDVRVTPNGKARSRDDARKDYLPESTIVSSPVQSANRRRLARYQHNNGGGDESDSDMDSDGFGRIRIAGKRERNKANVPGPPITQDHRFDQLDSLHKAVAEDFMVYAKMYCQDLVLQKGLRNQPFSDTILREMVMVFPKDKTEMLRIPNIDPDKVHRYGDRILKLVRDTQRRYTELKKDQEDVDGVVPDPNHHNVVNISSGDEFSDFDDFVDQESVLQPKDDVVTSQYFPKTQQTIVDSDDDYRPSPKAGSSKASSSKPRSQKTSKQTRRKSADPKPKAKGSRSKPKTSSKTCSRSQGRAFPRKESKGKQKQPTSQIAMMPI
ncbi:hypothetical protein BJX61DRAFT_538674 [Aspergillus egyptiacus]|nr:hypothetical protein BJX61DRAFT_538674 [Aspergillus egyptiacus]